MAPTILLITFAAYCYLPYLIARGVFVFVFKRAAVPPGSQFREFITAAIPGAVFNAAALAISRLILGRAMGHIDWGVVGSLFAPDQRAGLFATWVSGGELYRPLAYLLLVNAIALIWSFFTVVAMRRLEPPAPTPEGGWTTGRLIAGLLYRVLILILMLPLASFFEQRNERQEWGVERSVVIGFRDGSVIVGSVRAYDFSGEQLVGITLDDAVRVRTVEHLASLLYDTSRRTKPVHYTVNFPAAEILRLLAVQFPIHEKAMSEIAALFPLTPRE
jgi:hypothetical protein